MIKKTQNLPLSNIRIADFGWMIAGPLTTRVFANYGAEVIRIESSSRIDEIRVVGARPFVNESPNQAGVFNDINTSKLSMTLDLNTPKGLDLAKQVIEISDIVSNNFRGDRMAKWGLDYANLKKIKPDIILLSMPMTGSDGPHQEYGGNGISIIAGAGISGITGFPERPPVGTGSLYPDFSGNPSHGALALLAALRHKNKTGKGQFIDLAQTESTAALLGTSMLEYTVNNKIPVRPGNTSKNACPHNVYKCIGTDRWCAIAVTTNNQWRNLKHALANPTWMRNTQYDSLEGRLKNESTIDKKLSDWAISKNDYVVMEMLQQKGVPAGVVQTTKDLLENDKGYMKNHVIKLDHPEMTTMTLHGETIKISDTENTFTRAPLLGEHTDYVLGDLLGLSQNSINDDYVTGILK